VLQRERERVVQKKLGEECEVRWIVQKKLGEGGEVRRGKGTKGRKDGDPRL